MRALALVSQLVYGAEPSWEDPSRFSFSHGGKDRIPYEVDRELIDQNTLFLKAAVEESRLGQKEKLDALRKLNSMM